MISLFLSFEFSLVGLLLLMPLLWVMREWCLFWLREEPILTYKRIEWEYDDLSLSLSFEFSLVSLLLFLPLVLVKREWCLFWLREEPILTYKIKWELILFYFIYFFREEDLPFNMQERGIRVAVLIFLKRSLSSHFFCWIDCVGL